MVRAPGRPARRRLENRAIATYFSGKNRSAYTEIRAAEVEYTMLDKDFLGPDYKMVIV
jgi:hypothetical protein